MTCLACRCSCRWSAAHCRRQFGAQTGHLPMASVAAVPQRLSAHLWSIAHLQRVARDGSSLRQWPAFVSAALLSDILRCSQPSSAALSLPPLLSTALRYSQSSSAALIRLPLFSSVFYCSHPSSIAPIRPPQLSAVLSRPQPMLLFLTAALRGSQPLLQLFSSIFRWSYIIRRCL